MAGAKYTALQQIKQAEAKIRSENKVRDNAKNILNLAKLSGMSKTQAEYALEAITANSSPLSGALTLKDLKQFNKAYQALSKDFAKKGIAGGIHPRTIINRSRRVDIDRADREIPIAKPVSISSDGVVKFWVSASAKSSERQHYVVVQFLNFGAALAANRVTNEVIDMVLKGAVKFDCDCGRHRYWYRYIATTGGFYYGNPETGFPKVRNPNLGGLACKHVIRVMNVILKSNAFRQYIKQAILRYQDKPNARSKNMTDKQLKELVGKMQKESWLNQKTRRSSKETKKFEFTPDVFNARKPVSIKGAKIKPIELAKERSKSKTAAQKADERKRAGLIAKLSGMSTEQLEKLLKGIE